MEKRFFFICVAYFCRFFQLIQFDNYILDCMTEEEFPEHIKAILQCMQDQEERDRIQKELDRCMCKVSMKFDFLEYLWLNISEIERKTSEQLEYLTSSGKKRHSTAFFISVKIYFIFFCSVFFIKYFIS